MIPVPTGDEGAVLNHVSFPAGISTSREELLLLLLFPLFLVFASLSQESNDQFL